MKIIDANSSATLALGRCGENLARQVVFDVADFENLYGVGTVEILYQRPNDAQPYPLAVQRDGTIITWNVTSTDTAISSAFGKCELRYYSGETLVKSKIWQTWVDDALSTPSETVPPEPQQGWVDQVVAAGAEAKQASAEAKDAAGRADFALDKAPKITGGTWWTYDAEKQVYVDTGIKAEAKDGYTPVKGVDYFDGAPGKDGKDGRNGADGYTPIKGVDYFDGVNGKDGINGTNGKDGADGYTPVKGVDYFTDADKQELVQDVLNILPNAEEGNF